MLGNALHHLVVRQGSKTRTVTAAGPCLTHGFHAFEPDLNLRWNNGQAVLLGRLLDGFRGKLELVIHQAGATSYIDEPVACRAA